MEITFKPTIKQFDAWTFLNDPTITEVLYGGAAGSGKSMLGCAWLIISCMAYPGTRWLMGRSKLNILKTTTLKTFNDLVRDWGLSETINVNHQSNIIYFDNGSEIIMKDLFSYPSDPDFDSLGSLEVTGCFLDEVAQISHKAFEILQTRIRYRLKEYNLTPKLFMSCNPSKGWLYTQFYKPYIDNSLLKYRKFIPALPTDNPYIDPNYVIQLRKASRVIQERLLFGNWDYSDDIDSLFRYQDLIRMKDVSNIIPGKNKYITADIARLGKDRTIIMIWDGLNILQITQMDQVTTDISAQKILELSIQYGIPLKNVVIDSDGVGGGVVDQLKGSVAFVNNSKAIIQHNQPNNYSNLKSQCYYILAEYIEQNKIKIITIQEEIFELMCQELQIIKQKDVDKDGKLAVIPKDIIKKVLGRSPDYADAMMMRIYFELSNRIFNPRAASIYVAKPFNVKDNW